jgi:hypothetical protein
VQTQVQDHHDPKIPKALSTHPVAWQVRLTNHWQGVSSQLRPPMILHPQLPPSPRSPHSRPWQLKPQLSLSWDLVPRALLAQATLRVRLVDTGRLRRRDVELQPARLHIGLSCLARAAGDENEADTIVWQPGQLCRYGNIVLVIGWNSFGNELCLKPPMNDDDQKNRSEEMEDRQ